MAERRRPAAQPSPRTRRRTRQPRAGYRRSSDTGSRATDPAFPRLGNRSRVTGAALELTLSIDHGCGGPHGLPPKTTGAPRAVASQALGRQVVAARAGRSSSTARSAARPEAWGRRTRRRRAPAVRRLARPATVPCRSTPALAARPGLPLAPAPVGEADGGPTLRPSVGNWQHACQSHYLITRGEVLWCDQWSAEEIAAGRRGEEERRREYYEALDRQRGGVVQKLWRWMKSLFER